MFESGDYARCEVSGPRANEILAFARQHQDRLVVTAVQRFAARAERSNDWRGTEIHVAPQAADTADVFTGYRVRRSALDPAELFAALPIAVLAPADGHGKA